MNVITRLMNPQMLALTFIISHVSAAVAQDPDSSEAPELTLEEIVQLNEQSLGLIHTVELTMHHEIRHFIGGEPYGEPERTTWDWAMKGDVQRIRYAVPDPPTDDGRPQGLHDWYVDRESIKLLRNWNPDDPQKITPLNQGTIVASQAPVTRKAPGRDVTRFLLWMFSLDTTDDRRSFAELVAESPDVEFRGLTLVDGRKLWSIRAAHPGIDGHLKPGFYFDIFLDPEVNFNVRRVVEHHEGYEKYVNNSLETYSMDIERTVTSFRDVGNGVYFPLKIDNRVTSTLSDDRKSLSPTTVTDLRVNQPLSKGALDFRFPENATVVFGPPERPDHQRVVLWGRTTSRNKRLSRYRTFPVSMKPWRPPLQATILPAHPRKKTLNRIQSAVSWSGSISAYWQ